MIAFSFKFTDSTLLIVFKGCFLAGEFSADGDIFGSRTVSINIISSSSWLGLLVKLMLCNLFWILACFSSSSLTASSGELVLLFAPLLSLEIKLAPIESFLLVLELVFTFLFGEIIFFLFRLIAICSSISFSKLAFEFEVCAAVGLMLTEADGDEEEEVANSFVFGVFEERRCVDGEIGAGCKVVSKL